MTMSQGGEGKKIEVPEGFAPIEKPSAFGQLIGPVYERMNEDGTFVRALRVEDKHTNLGGVVHGGVLMSFADVILGTVCYRHTERPGASIRLVTDFVAPARVGDWLEGCGEVVKATRSVVFARGELTIDGRPVMTMSGTYKLRAQPSKK